jgi:hypothetical protein
MTKQDHKGALAVHDAARRAGAIANRIEAIDSADDKEQRSISHALRLVHTKTAGTRARITLGGMTINVQDGDFAVDIAEP